MPPYGHLIRAELDPTKEAAHLVANRDVGVPYTDDMISNAAADMVAQADPNRDSSGLVARYGKKVPVSAFDGDPTKLTEMDALVAYLQMLGTEVDFTNYEPLSEENRR
jgi:cytochrome c oxidase cbb3-type subunit 2